MKYEDEPEPHRVISFVVPMLVVQFADAVDIYDAEVTHRRIADGIPEDRRQATSEPPADRYDEPLFPAFYDFRRQEVTHRFNEYVFTSGTIQFPVRGKLAANSDDL